ncbi:hypothetical protein PAHAL_6G205700 [Panicum hallii]|uniref:Uncharacterized protein n=1 Tax=Panicum hallii TaxID=206008 RepID=A0A2S3I299_9POAL|nr:hypothetical protein PAHAL_6G205700 [Panicum hallii]
MGTPSVRCRPLLYTRDRCRSLLSVCPHPRLPPDPLSCSFGTPPLQQRIHLRIRVEASPVTAMRKEYFS